MRLEDLDRRELAQLAREYMLTAQLNDRTGLAAVGLDPRLDLARVAIEEWMGASPLYSRRMQAAMGFEGDDVPTIFKNLQLDSGFAHQYFDVHYEVASPTAGRFWLTRCGALDDVEPRGEEMVFLMCHTIEDPTFDATAVATNRHAQVRPVHRPPRVDVGDASSDVCEWAVEIDPANPRVEDHPLMAAVEDSALMRVVIERPAPEAGDDGMARYDGEVMHEPHLELFSKDALVVICKELALQVHLLVRALGLSVAAMVGEEVASEILEAEMTGTAWVVSERLARHFGLQPGAVDLEGIEMLLSLHPAFQPREYQPVAVVRAEEGIELCLPDSPASDDPRHASWSGLLREGRTAGLDALVQGMNRRAVVTPVEGAAEPTWTVSVDDSREPAPTPEWATITQLSGASSWEFEQQVAVRTRSAASTGAAGRGPRHANLVAREAGVTWGTIQQCLVDGVIAYLS